jgi:predicted ATP-grasp superfamily ATP-dependent carboligase
VRIAVYEHLTATAAPGDWPESVVCEGRAMLSAICSDLASNGAQVVTAVHPLQEPLAVEGLTVLSSAGDALQIVRQLALASEKIVLIAPEFDEILFQLAQEVECVGGGLLGPGGEDVRHFSDKLATNRRLGDLAIPTFLWPELPAGSGPVVIKPRCGAGSLYTYVGTRDRLSEIVASIREWGYGGELVAQPFVEGKAVSVGLMCTPGTPAIVLPAAEQNITIEWRTPDIGEFSYEGGAAPAAAEVKGRVRRLVDQFLEIHDRLSGYLGVDMVIGEDEDSDRIVEVNPRLTTAYIGYSKLIGPSMGRFFLGDGPELRWAPGRVVHFTCQGVQAED